MNIKTLGTKNIKLNKENTTLVLYTKNKGKSNEILNEH